MFCALNAVYQFYRNMQVISKRRYPQLSAYSSEPIIKQCYQYGIFKNTYKDGIKIVAKKGIKKRNR